MSIPSPYNFVPLSEHVYFPGYDRMISHDIPFSDGCSGSIEIEITAETPIYVRNGGNHPEKNEERIKLPQYQSFFKVTENGRFAIPGTSIRGMLRNIVEIASFSKMARIDAHHRYGVRDLNNPNRKLYMGHMTTDKQPYASRCKAGWLKEQDNNWVLTPCEFARVQIGDLQAYSKIYNLGRKQSAADKYNKWGPNLEVNFELDPVRVHDHGSYNYKGQWKPLNLQYNKVRRINGGNLTGTIVFTGQPSDYDPQHPQRRKKHMEFIFYNPKSTTLSISAEVKRDFNFIHSDPNGKPNEEWGYWRSKLSDEKVPVFYLEEDGQVRAMGLAMMFRLPYRYSIGDAVDHTSKLHLHSHDKLDLAEIVFGRVDDESTLNPALRGRVFIEPAINTADKPQEQQVVETVLGAPKPTYYPNYVKQNTTTDRVDRYITYMDNEVELRGWKRYWVRKSGDKPTPIKPPTNRDGQINYATVCRFKPLAAGTKFTGRIYLHNIRKLELGALLWALTWGGDSQLRHQIGLAKPYGFGTVRIEIKDLSQVKNLNGQAIDCDAALNTFKAAMEKFAHTANIAGGWKQSQQIRSLLAMADPSRTNLPNCRYPSLGVGPGANDFAKFKHDNYCLEQCVAPVNPTPKPPVVKNPPKTPAPTQQPTNDIDSEGIPAKTIALAQELINAKSKEAAQKIAAIWRITPKEYKYLEQMLNKRTDATTSDPAMPLKWRTELAELKTRVK